MASAYSDESLIYYNWVKVNARAHILHITNHQTISHYWYHERYEYFDATAIASSKHDSDGMEKSKNENNEYSKENSNVIVFIRFSRFPL